MTYRGLCPNGLRRMAPDWPSRSVSGYASGGFGAGREVAA